MNYNKVILMGHLTRDPELRYTPKGTAVAGFAIAVNHNWSDSDGNKKEEVAFIDIDAWGKTAEVITEYLKKGSPIHLEGRIKMDTWEDKETQQKRSKLKVVLERFQFVGGKQEDNGNGGSRRPPSRGAASERPQQDAPAGSEVQGEPTEDDVPF